MQARKQRARGVQHPDKIIKSATKESREMGQAGASKNNGTGQTPHVSKALGKHRLHIAVD